MTTRRTFGKIAVAGAAGGMLAGCGGNVGELVGRTRIDMWFWGATPTQRAALEKHLVEAYNVSQDEFELNVTYNERVDSSIQTALAAAQGPDIVYGSGPSFVAPFVKSGRLINLDKYAEKYGWKDRILPPIYESGTVDGSLYALANSINTIGIYYNKRVLDDLGVEIPSDLESLEAALAAADEAGLYPSVTGNKGWQAVNENYSSMFLTAVAGPEAMYQVLTGEASWTDEPYARAVDMSAEWYQNGYFGGGQYTNLNFLESVQLLADGESPFFFGPTLAFQFAVEFFNAEQGNVDELGFIPFPTVGDGLDSPLFTLGTTASFSINERCKNPDAAAEILDRMLNEEFMQTMTAEWPGYWAVPLVGAKLDPRRYEGLSAVFAETVNQIFPAVEEGRFGYYSGTFFPPQTQQAMVDIDTVWTDVTDTATFLQGIDETFSQDLEVGAVPPIPEP